MPLTVPVLRVLEACRGERTAGPLVLRPVSGKPIDRRDVYRMVQRIAKTAQIPRHISPHSLRHAAITNALDAGVPLRDAQILARSSVSGPRVGALDVPDPFRRALGRAVGSTVAIGFFALVSAASAAEIFLATVSRTKSKSG